MQKIALLIAVMFAVGATRSLWTGACGSEPESCVVSCAVSCVMDQEPCDLPETTDTGTCEAIMACCHCCCYCEDLKYFVIRMPRPESARPYFYEAQMPTGFISDVFHPPNCDGLNPEAPRVFPELNRLFIIKNQSNEKTHVARRSRAGSGGNCLVLLLDMLSRQ